MHRQVFMFRVGLNGEKWKSKEMETKFRGKKGLDHFDLQLSILETEQCFNTTVSDRDEDI